MSSFDALPFASQEPPEPGYPRLRSTIQFGPPEEFPRLDLLKYGFPHIKCVRRVRGEYTVRVPCMRLGRHVTARLVAVEEGGDGGILVKYVDGQDMEDLEREAPEGLWARDGKWMDPREVRDENPDLFTEERSFLSMAVRSVAARILVVTAGGALLIASQHVGKDQDGLIQPLKPKASPTGTEKRSASDAVVVRKVDLKKLGKTAKREERDPDASKTHLVSAEAHRDRKEWPEAIDKYVLAIEEDYFNTYAWIGLAHALDDHAAHLDARASVLKKKNLAAGLKLATDALVIKLSADGLWKAIEENVNDMPVPPEPKKKNK